jgi:hypothetical protein
MSGMDQLETIGCSEPMMLESAHGRGNLMSDDLTKRIDSQENGEKLTQILTIVQNLDARLGSLEQTVEHRPYDTRPIWEKVQTDIAQLREGQANVHGEVREIKTAIRDFNRKFSIFHDTLVTIQADYRDIYDRVRDIERQHT